MSHQTGAALFDEVYAAHRQALHGYFFGRTGDAEVAADLLQETFLRAWRNLHTLCEMPPDQHRYWFFAIGKNLLTDHYRKQSPRTMAEETLEEEIPALAEQTPPPDVQIEHKDLLQWVDRAIQQLPEQMRMVLVMQVLGEMNSAEIGEALDMPAGTVRYQLSQARRRLAKDLQLSGHSRMEERGVL
jgi:RNA polymerase sigma-70 factor (ECF subfamily)